MSIRRTYALRIRRLGIKLQSLLLQEAFFGKKTDFSQFNKKLLRPVSFLAYRASLDFFKFKGRIPKEDLFAVSDSNKNPRLFKKLFTTFSKREASKTFIDVFTKAFSPGYIRDKSDEYVALNLVPIQKEGIVSGNPSVFVLKSSDFERLLSVCNSEQELLFFYAVFHFNFERISEKIIPDYSKN